MLLANLSMSKGSINLSSRRKSGYHRGDGAEIKPLVQSGPTVDSARPRSSSRQTSQESPSRIGPDENEFVMVDKSNNSDHETDE